MLRPSLVLLSAVAIAAGQSFSLRLTAPAEVVAEVRALSRGADWSVQGSEAGVAELTVDGTRPQHIILYGGPFSTAYQVFLGELSAGDHSVRITRSGHSAPNAGVEIESVRFVQHRPGDRDYAAIAAAPVLFARKNTIGTFSDVPLLLYCERLREGGGDIIQYTAIFSNEDGGTSTRALMARWGRTTDIEYIYRVYLDAGGRPQKRTVQGPNHRELPYEGQFEGSHPLLIPVTQNNMVAPAQPDQELRFQLAPQLVDLTAKPRESVMDSHPLTYQVMAKELIREGKLRPFGVVEGEKISDPANYLFVSYEATFATAGLGVTVALRDGRSFSSDLGRVDLLIARDGAVQTAVELPQRTSLREIAGITFACAVVPASRAAPLPHSGQCTVRWAEAGFKVRGGQQPEWHWRSREPAVLLAGQGITFRP